MLLPVRGCPLPLQTWHTGRRVSTETRNRFRLRYLALVLEGSGALRCRPVLYILGATDDVVRVTMGRLGMGLTGGKHLNRPWFAGGSNF